MGREALSIENDSLRLTVLRGGGHIAEVFSKQANVNPLWIPHWPSVEPSAYQPAHHPEFGSGSDAKLLASIMGHNLCLDLFGGPSPEEAAAGLTAHGEGSTADYDLVESPASIAVALSLPLSQLRFTRTLTLHGPAIEIRESVQNLTAQDRPLAWTQHVTLAPPFLDPATTVFQASVARSMVAETDPGSNGYLQPGMPFDWPMAPCCGGLAADLRHMRAQAPASAYTAHLTHSAHEHAFFLAHSTAYRLTFGYIWRRDDFPWLGIWEENRSRLATPWNGRAVTRGMEFGVSPFPESRRAMVERGHLFGQPTFRWLPALGRLQAVYWIVTGASNQAPETLLWPASAL